MQRRFLAALLSLLFVQCAVVHLVRTAVRDRDEIAAPKAGTIDDASRMNAVAISEIVDVSPDDAIAIEQIRSALTRARAAKAGVSIAGFRHSMGGHTSAPDGIVLNMLPHNRMEMLADGEILHVQSGAVWKDVIAYLDARSRSVVVMQSDNPFSVGGSLSVNCHVSAVRCVRAREEARGSGRGVQESVVDEIQMNGAGLVTPPAPST